MKRRAEGTPSPARRSRRVDLSRKRERGGAVPIAFAIALAACSPPAPRVDSEGQAAQKVMDAATKLYSDCITGHADAMPVNDEAAGTLALRILKTCKGTRDDLVVKVAKFHLIGHPREGQPMADAVAEASVQAIDDELRGNAVVTIVKRQTEADKAKTGMKT